MTNVFITKDGKKVSLGEPFSITTSSDEDGVKKTFIFSSSNLSPEQVKILITEGILKEEKGFNKEEEFSTPTTDEIITLISMWLMNTPHAKETAVEFLSILPNYTLFSIVLKAIAVLIDRKYPNHINNADVDKYYTIDMTNGKVYEIPKNKIKNFRNFAAFRSIDDIKIATKIMRPLIKELWPDE